MEPLIRPAREGSNNHRHAEFSHDDRLIVATSEATIDLEMVSGQIEEVRKTRKSAAEVINRKVHASAIQVDQVASHDVVQPEDLLLGQLNHKATRLEVHFFEPFKQLIGTEDLPLASLLRADGRCSTVWPEG